MSSSVVKHRTELLSALLQQSAGLHPSHPRFAALDRTTNSIVSFHTFLDTYPDVINAEWAQLTERLENNAQFDKAAILTALKEKLLSLEIQSSQRDYPQRLLSFLLASSRKVLSTIVDQAGPDQVLALASHAQHKSNVELEPWESSEDDYGAVDAVYSSGDTLSDWSQDEGSQDDESSIDGQVDKGVDVSRAHCTMHPGPGISSSVAVGNEYPIPGVRSLLHRRSRDPLHGGPSGFLEKPPCGCAEHPYGGSSLSVWFASKESQGHPSRVIDPRRCFTDAELVQQVLDMLKGLSCPGPAFHFDDGIYRARGGVHTRDIPPTSAARLLARFAELGTQLHRLQRFCDAVVYKEAEKLGGLPTIAAFAAAAGRGLLDVRGQLVELERMMHTNENNHESKPTLVSLHLALAPVRRQAAALDRVVQECRWNENPRSTVNAVLDALHAVLETSLTQSGAAGGVLGAMLAEIYAATLKPMLDTLEEWIQKGSVKGAPPEFFIQQRREKGEEEDDLLFWEDAYCLESGADGNAVVPRVLAHVAQSILQTGSVVAALGNLRQEGEESAGLNAFVSSSHSGCSLHRSFCDALAKMVLQRAQSMLETVERMDNGQLDSDTNCLQQVHHEEHEYLHRQSSKTNAVSLYEADTLPNLINLPKSILELDFVSICPNTSTLDTLGAGDAAQKQRGYGAVFAAMRASASKRMHLAVAGRQYNIAADFQSSSLDVFSIKASGMDNAGTPPGVFLNCLNRGDALQAYPRSWAEAPGLSVLLDSSLLGPLHATTQRISAAACHALLSSGLLAQLSSLRSFALMRSLELDQFVDHLLTRSSTPRGIAAVSALELSAALQEGLLGLSGPNHLTRPQKVFSSACVFILDGSTPLATPRRELGFTAMMSTTDISRVRIALRPAFPLSILADQPMLHLHAAICTLALQLRWAARSLQACHAAELKDRGVRTRPDGRSSRLATVFAMVQLVNAVQLHVQWCLEAAGMELDQRVSQSATVHLMRGACAEYISNLRRLCLFETSDTDGRRSQTHEALLNVLDLALQHCYILGQGRRTADLFFAGATASDRHHDLAPSDSMADGEVDAVVTDAGVLTAARRRQLDAAISATQREFESKETEFLRQLALLCRQLGAEGGEELHALLATLGSSATLQMV